MLRSSFARKPAARHRRLRGHRSRSHCPPRPSPAPAGSARLPRRRPRSPAARRSCCHSGLARRARGRPARGPARDRGGERASTTPATAPAAGTARLALALLRLLRRGQLRARSRGRRPPRLAARLGFARALGRARQGQLDHRLHERRPRLRGVAGLRFDTSIPDDGQAGPGWSKDVKAGLVNGPFRKRHFEGL